MSTHATSETDTRHQPDDAPRVVHEPLPLETLMDETEDPTAGAMVVFSGTVRNHHEGHSVEAIGYSAYQPLAERVLRELEAEVCQRFPVARCRIMHRVGELAIGDSSVLVVVRAAHRGDAFEAARYAIDTLKERAPFWKNERFTDGSSAYQDGVALDGEHGAQEREEAQSTGGRE